MFCFRSDVNGPYEIFRSARQAKSWIVFLCDLSTFSCEAAAVSDFVTAGETCSQRTTHRRG